MKACHHLQQCGIQHARQPTCTTIEPAGCCCCCVTRTSLCDATWHDQGLSHTTGQTVCLCAVQGAAERASPYAISHTHQVRPSVCALCREQLRELHQMQELGVEEHGRDTLQAGMAEEAGSGDRCCIQCRNAYNQSRNVYIQFRNVYIQFRNVYIQLGNVQSTVRINLRNASGQ